MELHVEDSLIELIPVRGDLLDTGPTVVVPETDGPVVTYRGSVLRPWLRVWHIGMSSNVMSCVYRLKRNIYI